MPSTEPLKKKGRKAGLTPGERKNAMRLVTGIGGIFVKEKRTGEGRKRRKGLFHGGGGISNLCKQRSTRGKGRGGERGGEGKERYFHYQI